MSSLEESVDEIGNVETSYFQITEPKEQKEERQEEKGKVQEGIRLLEEIIARFAERANNADSIKKAHLISKEYSIPIESALAALDVISREFADETDRLEGLRQTYN